MSATEKLDIGVDPSGRKIRLTRRMKAAFDRTTEECGFTPTILQGAFMQELGGGADASAGYHDLAGCIDTRTKDLSDQQQDKLIRCARSLGWAVWKRDAAHGGMDDHMHWVLLGEPDMADGARQQEADYHDGLDGLATRGRDYHWRPPVIQPFDYDNYLEGDMPNMQELKEELVPAIINQLMHRNINPQGMTVADALRQASRADDLKKLLEGLPREVASAVEAALPAGEEMLTRAQVRAAAQSGAESALSKLLAGSTVTV